jgi:sulfur relay (sulfurtransferase) complex TusBCD TusD component (DsrE family)
MNQEHIMSQSLEQIREQFDSQLDLTLRLLKVSGLYAEKIMETHFLMLHGVLQKATLPERPSVEHSWQSLSDHGNVLVGYCKTCMQEGLDYQRKVLSEISRK